MDIKDELPDDGAFVIVHIEINGDFDDGFQQGVIYQNDKWLLQLQHGEPEELTVGAVTHWRKPFPSPPNPQP